VANVLVVSDHWILAGIVHGILGRAGYTCIVKDKLKDACDYLRQKGPDLIVVYLSLGLGNDCKNNRALAFAQWLAEQDGQYPPSIVLMRGYEDCPRFRVADLSDLPFQGGQGEFREDKLLEISRDELPQLIAARLAQVAKGA